MYSSGGVRWVVSSKGRKVDSFQGRMNNTTSIYGDWSDLLVEPSILSRF